MTHCVNRSLSASAGACLAGILLLVSASGADARVVTCKRPANQTTVGFILSARNMSCRAATRYYRRHQGDQHAALRAGEVEHIGRFTCRVYQDLTPPGPSDAWVRIRCVSGGQAFRYEYGV